MQALHDLYAEMRAVAEANPYTPPGGLSEMTLDNLVAEVCERTIEINGKSYTVVFSLNEFHVPKFRFLPLFIHGFYHTVRFWQLTVSGHGVYPSDDLIQRFHEAFFSKDTPVIEITAELRKQFPNVIPATQRQFSQLVPDHLVKT